MGPSHTDWRHHCRYRNQIQHNDLCSLYRTNIWRAAHVPQILHTPVLDDGKPLDVNIINYVRYLKFGIKAEMLKFEKDLIDKNLISFEQAGNTKVYSASCSLLMKEGLKNLAKNPFYFLETPPEFEEGNIPLV